jgi:hypothetical protein
VLAFYVPLILCHVMHGRPVKSVYPPEPGSLFIQVNAYGACGLWGGLLILYCGLFGGLFG